MKTSFSILLVLNLLVELMAAATLIGGPEGMVAAGTGGQWSMHYGFAALAVASLSIWVWPYRTELQPVTVALGLLMTFHIGVLCSLVMAGDQPLGVVLHGVLAPYAVLMFLLRRRWCDAGDTREI